MLPPHDVVRQVSYLRQCLSQGDRHLGLFIGAGCPLAVRVRNGDDDDPLIPGIEGITNIVCDTIIKGDKAKDALAIILQHFNEDSRLDQDIEAILTHVRSLHSVAGKGDVRGLRRDQLRDLDTEICKHIVDVVTRELPASTPYHDVAAWINYVPRTVPVHVFTTNYDLLLEQALEQGRVPYFDGFVGAHQPFFDPAAMEDDVLPSRWARVWKLHGSINWIQNGEGGVCRVSRSEEGQRHIIHPSDRKYEESRRMPYFAMIDRLRWFLKQPSAVLIISGYSFRDQHLNEVIRQGLQGNASAAAFGLLRGSLSAKPIAKDLALTRSNLHLLAKNEAILGTREAPWAERERPDSALHHLGVEWLPKKADDAEGSHVPQFTLGDFAKLGEFLADLIGKEDPSGGGARLA